MDFSLVDGGPFDALLRRAGLGPAASHCFARRIICAVGISWVPLLILSLAQNIFLPGRLRMSFLHDFETHVRFLIIVPLLIAAERPVQANLSRLVRQFLDQDLIPPSSESHMKHLLASARSLLDSSLAELMILFAVIFLISAEVHAELLSPMEMWRCRGVSTLADITWAGWWFYLISRPIFSFLVFRWLWRLIVWALFLGRVSRIPLRLVPTHPDGAGGIGFLGPGQTAAFRTLIFTLSAVGSIKLIKKMFFEGATLVSLRSEIIALVACLVAVFLGPLFFFGRLLFLARLKGLLDYGILASRYTQSFDRKWNREILPSEEKLLGTSDIQALADLQSAYGRVKEMRFVPIQFMEALMLAAYAALPMVPLLFLAFPVEQILKHAIKLLFIR